MARRQSAFLTKFQKRKMRGGRFRNCVVTSWREEILVDKSIFKYYVHHREKCPDTGRLHYHVYCEFVKQQTVASVKEIFGDPTIHVEKRRGTAQQAREYVLKDKNEFEPLEFGVMSKQGRRTDLEGVMESIQGGASMADLAEKHPAEFIKYSGGISRARFLLTSKRAKMEDRDVEVSVFYGPAGSGKTRAVFDLHRGDLFKLDAGNSVWFDGYEGESVLLIDDFYGWIKYGQLLNILDRYPLRLDVKGGHTWAQWTKVYITSNRHPESWYSQGMTPALERRLHNIRDFNEGPDVVSVCSTPTGVSCAPGFSTPRINKFRSVFCNLPRLPCEEKI